MMKLAYYLRPAKNITNLRETYTSMDNEEVSRIIDELAASFAEEIDEYVRAQQYPKVSADIYKPHMLTRLPEHIRAGIIDRVDEAFHDAELLLKFDVYMVLCTGIGNIIASSYAERYQKMIEKLTEVGIKKIDVKNN